MTATTTADTFHPTTLPIFTAREWLLATEPWLLELMLGSDKALAGDSKKAGEIAAEGGLSFDAAGYPALVWMQVYP